MAILQSVTINDTGFVNIPVGTTAQRIAGGSVITSFTSVGTTSWTCPANVNSIELLVVAGGGGGGGGFDTWAGGGGGGAGGLIYYSSYTVTPGSVYTVTVGGGGAGGVGSASPRYGAAGGNAVFGPLTAIGGSGGNAWNSGTGSTSPAGGSGGGGQNSSGSFVGALGTTGQGFNGGAGMAYTGNNNSSAGGGGGAGGVGGTAGRQMTAITMTSIDGQYGGVGGTGFTCNITGVEQVYAGGGGGGGGVYGGSGGSGIGGNGGNGTGSNGTNATANTGSGGGGAGSTVNPNGTTSGGAGSSGIVVIRYNTNSTPGGTLGALRINSSTNKIEYASGSGNWMSISMPFLTRTVITNAYMMGGYKDAVTWNNVNRIVCATDTTTNLGDNSIERSFNYQSGACGKNIAFVFGAANAHATSSNYVIAFNMRTETQYLGSFSRTLNYAKYNTGTVFKEHYVAWNTGGGGSNIDEYNLTTETKIQDIAGFYSGACWGMSTENYGIIFWENDDRMFTFATRTFAVRTSATKASNHSQQKSVNSKVGYGWAGNEGDYAGGNNYRRTNFTTNVSALNLAKPVTNSGEENYTMGQEYQYCLGMYNGLQNNISWKFNYSTETGAQGSSTMEPKGKAGASSGSTAWRD